MTRIYVANVSSKADYDELKDLFGECGKVKSFGVKDGAGFIVKNNNNLQEYDTLKEAEDSIVKYNK